MGNRTTTSCSIGRCSTTELCRPGPIWIFNKVSPMILYFGGGIIRILFWGVVTISSPVIQVVFLKTIPPLLETGNCVCLALVNEMWEEAACHVHVQLSGLIPDGRDFVGLHENSRVQHPSGSALFHSKQKGKPFAWMHLNLDTVGSCSLARSLLTDIGVLDKVQSHPACTNISLRQLCVHGIGPHDTFCTGNFCC